MSQPDTAPTARPRTPLAKSLKGVFFFLVTLIVVSQMSPLLSMHRLLSQERERTHVRLNDAVATLHATWMETPVDQRENLDLGLVAHPHGLRSLEFTTVELDRQGDHIVSLSWDALDGMTHRTITAGASVNESEDAPGTPYLATLSVHDTWQGSPVAVNVALATPVLGGLTWQFKSEMWLRALVLLCFVPFTILFYRSVLLPFHDMRKRASALVESGILPPAPGGGDQDPEYVMATFDLLLHRFSQQAGRSEARAIHSEKHARDLEQFNDYILSSLTTGVIIIGRSGEILRFNRAAEQILRLPSAAMMGTHYTRAGLAPNLVELFNAGLGRGEVYSRHELRVEREDGKPLWLGINTSCIRGDSDESMGLSVLLTDLTAIRKLQEDLAENQRLADLGEMAAGLAHQLRNSMAAILGYGRLLKGSAPAQGQLGDWADGVLSETAETSEMITRFLDFARPLQTETAPVDLHEVVASAVEQVSRQNAECGIQIAEWQAQELHPTVVRGDEMLLKQVFVNLLQNAIDASLPGKRIDVSLRKERTVNGMEFWQVVVADQGCGIPRENRGKIFHPFFTTKDTGTGLGLALARKIVASHGGRLTLQDSTPSGGATFVVALPVSGASPPASSPSQGEEIPRTTRTLRGSSPF